MRKGEARSQDLAALIEAQDYDGALEALAALEAQRPLTTGELVQRGRFIQLASERAPELSEAERVFAEALALDEDYVPALLELAWFYYAVEDNSPRALPLFEKAVGLAREQLTEAVIGKARCLEETQAPEAADRFFEDFRCGKFFETEKGWRAEDRMEST